MRWMNGEEVGGDDYNALPFRVTASESINRDSPTAEEKLTSGRGEKEMRQRRAGTKKFSCPVLVGREWGVLLSVFRVGRGFSSVRVRGRVGW